MPAVLPRPLRTTALGCATAALLTVGLTACGGDDFLPVRGTMTFRLQ